MCQKSWRAFSNIPRDQMHEQLICWLENHAGVIENLDVPSTVRCEKVVRPEMAPVVREFEGTDESDERIHHDQYPKFQSDYTSNVIALVHLNRLGTLSKCIKWWTYQSLCLWMW